MGAWHFVEHYLEWVLNQIEAKNRRPRYADAAGVGGDRGRPDVEAPGAAQAAARRGARLVAAVITGPREARVPVIPLE